MPFESSHPIAPPIRGALRAELIQKLAIGEQTHEELAVEFDRTLDAIRQFSSRNKDEIRSAKRALIASTNTEWVGVAIANKFDRISDASQDWEDIKLLLEDPNLTPSQRRHYLALKDKLRHSVAEELGELPVRAQLQVDLKHNPLTDYDVLALGDDGQLHPVKP